MAQVPDEVQRLIDDAAEWARPLEDEAAAEEIARAKRGRPRLSDEDTEQIVVRLPSSLRDKLNARAKKDHETASSVAREALERYLAA